MEPIKISSTLWFLLVTISLSATVLGASLGGNGNLNKSPNGGLQLGEEKATGTVESKREGRGGFFDDFLEGLSGMEVNVQKVVNKGSSVVKQVQSFQSSSGGTKIIKTEITQVNENSPFVGRYKRDLGDNLEAAFGNFHNRVDRVKDKMSGVLVDTANAASHGYFKVKDAIATRLPH